MFVFFFRSTSEASDFVSHRGKKYITVYWQSHHHKQDAFPGASRWNCCSLHIYSLSKMATLVAVKIEAIQQFCSAEKGSLVLLEIICFQSCSATDSLTFGSLSLVCSHPLWSKTPQWHPHLSDFQLGHKNEKHSILFCFKLFRADQ